MLTTLATAALAVLATTVEIDTTLAVRSGTRLEVDNFGGAVTVLAWPKNAVRLAAIRPSRSRIQIERAEGALLLRSVGLMGPPGSVEMNLQVPKWMEVRISGVFSEASVLGIEAPVRIETVRGDVLVRGGRQYLELQTVEGSITVEGARGRVEAHSVNEGVKLVDVEGEIAAESVNGAITLEKVRSGQVECSSVNGSLDYEGELRPGGHYAFSTHNGDITVVLPAKASADVSVATFNGAFESSFPVSFTRTHRGKRFRFVLGEGLSELELESFQGTIRLRRAGEKP